MTTSSPSPSETTEQFFDAIKRADVARLRAMVAEGFDIAAAEVEFDEGVMGYAVQAHFDLRSDPTPMLQVLLELGADINARVDGCSALLVAVYQCNVKVAEWLILHGAEINTIYPDFYDTVLDTAETDQVIYTQEGIYTDEGGYLTYEEYQQLIDMLLSYGAKRADELINQYFAVTH